MATLGGLFIRGRDRVRLAWSEMRLHQINAFFCSLFTTFHSKLFSVDKISMPKQSTCIEAETWNEHFIVVRCVVKFWSSFLQWTQLLHGRYMPTDGDTSREVAGARIYIRNDDLYETSLEVAWIRIGKVEERTCYSLPFVSSITMTRISSPYVLRNWLHFVEVTTRL